MGRLRFVVTGLVQGVGFRWFTVRSAQELGLRGWVRNRADGAVEGEAEGPADDVQRLLDVLRRGPGHARVDAVETTSVPARGEVDEGFVARG
ncbi:MAG: acylphosphatase [Planctomycetes bacterium]|nr:acylphosphatase [Planctomycetota bacterium]